MKNSDKEIPKMPIIAAIVLAIGVIAALYIAGTKKLSETEAVLLGILLTADSILISWLVTHIYSQFSLKQAIEQATEISKENIKNYAVKAAEKVLNLSNQIKRLSQALNEANEDSDSTNNPKEAVMLLHERISSAIHNLETLRSMNDTFLSDWRGVIGEEIEKQQLLEKQIDKLAEELEEQKRERDALKEKLVSVDDLSNIERLIANTEERIYQKFIDLPFKFISRSIKPKKEDISIKCPTCSAELKTKFRRKKDGKKLVSCMKCGQYILIHGVNEEETQIVLIKPYHYTGICPLCNTPIEFEIADYPGTTKSVKCNNCEINLLVSKTIESFNIKPHRPLKEDIPQKIIDQVRSLLPDHRPWPTHIHKQIAEQLGYSNKLVSRVISNLISQGHYPLSENNGNDISH
jgi:hypothetical protein